MPDEASLAAYSIASAKLQNERVELRERLQEIKYEEERITRRIASITAALDLLVTIEHGEPYEHTLADAIRSVLKASNKPLQPVAVRDQLVVAGYDVSKHTNIMASVHSVLKRLAEGQDVATRRSGGAAMYFWKGTLPSTPRETK